MSAANESLYPSSIQNAPPDLTTPSPAYRRQVVIVLASLAAFLLFYLGLIVASGWAVFWGVTQAANTPETAGSRHSNGGAYWTAALIAGVLFLFLMKALFKWRREKDESRLEITEQDQPELFGFIRRICADTKAPFPYRIFVTPEVNAAVFYNRSLLSLILPVKKNLLIGLGLVNGLNLSEFKAVLAHEFGHFSQSSMRLGSYVYMANRVIYDLVYHRDALDDLLAKARRTNIRIAIFAYLITFVLWALRQVLQVAFKLINFFERALSRQMEFHADLVAVSVTGSDSLIHALKKLDFVNDCQMQSFSDLKAAAEHKLYTHDLFYHQTRAADHLRRSLAEPELGVLPALPADPSEKIQLFTKEADEDDSEGMWASHPSHYDREQNAKRRYLRSVEDERSPWLLFRNPERLRQTVTERFYKQQLELPTLTFAPPEQVQQFIDGEHAETTQDARYLGMYDGRLLSIPSESLTEIANDPVLPMLPETRIQTLLDRLYNAEYKTWLETYQKRREENAFLGALERGEVKIKGDTFPFRDQPHKKAEMKSLLALVASELEADAEWLKAFDREVFLVHLRMAQIVGAGDRVLFDRYYFHLQLQDRLKAARQEEARLAGVFQFLSSKEDGLEKKEFAQALASLQEAQRSVSLEFDRAKALPMPPLQNVQPGLPLSAYLLEEPLVAPLPPDVKSIDGKWAGALMQQVSQIEERCRRLYFKSMGAILGQQEAIAQRYRSQQADAPPNALQTGDGYNDDNANEEAV